MATKQAARDRRLIAQNRRARFDYFIDDTIEAGIVLKGTEVKALREGRASLQDSFAAADGSELYLFNAYIPEYGPATRFNHETRRPRKLLMHKRELDRLMGAVKREGVTLVPVSMYFNKRGIAKVDLGLARGKKQHDKRQTTKERDWGRDKARLLRDRG